MSATLRHIGPTYPSPKVTNTLLLPGIEFAKLLFVAFSDDTAIASLA